MLQAVCSDVWETMARLIDLIPGLRLFIEKMDRGRAIDPEFAIRYLRGEHDIDGKPIPRSPYTVPRLKLAKLQTRKMGHLGGFASEPTSSWLGGQPAECDNSLWPTHQGERLTFVAQIALHDLEGRDDIEWLPSSGHLLFFVGRNEWGGFDQMLGRVVYVPCSARTAGLASEKQVRQWIHFERLATYEALQPEDDAGQADDSRKFESWYWDISPSYSKGAAWQVGGWPQPLQTGDMRRECERRYRRLAWDDYDAMNAPDFMRELESWHLIGQFGLDAAVEKPDGFMRGFYWIKMVNGEALFNDAVLIGQSD